MSHIRSPRPHRAITRAARDAAPSGALLLTALTVALLSLMIVTRPADARGAPESFADLAERLLPAVVNISTEQDVRRDGPIPEEFFERFRGDPNDQPRRATSLGSGFIIDGDAGIVITNNHVIEDADEIKVILQDETEFTATVVGRDPSTDVAVLKIDPAGADLPSVPWGDSDIARVGDWVVAIGNPLGLGGTVTAGIISARGRNIRSGPYDDYIQTDASINRGNSGGPLFNMEGEVIGINTAIFSQTGGSIGIGFSIPSNQALRVVSQIMTYGSTRRGWLGVSIQEVTDDIAESLGMEEPGGALISTVHDGGPAAEAGFEAGDIIIEFNSKPVKDTRELLRLVANAPVNEMVPVKIWRDGKIVDLSPTLGQREKVDLASLNTDEVPGQDGGQVSRLDALGLEIGPLTDALMEEFNIEPGQGGVVITGIAEGSDASEKDLEPGDVVLEVNQNPVSTTGDVESEVSEALDAGRSSVLLQVLRGDRKIFVAVRFER